jgi:hypothetical protein
MAEDKAVKPKVYVMPGEAQSVRGARGARAARASGERS